MLRGFAARLFSSLLATGLLVKPAAGQITVVAGPAAREVTATAGELVTVPIAVDMTAAPGVKLGAYRLSFRWNPALLQLVATAGGAFGAPVFNTDSAAQGVVKFSAAVAAGATGIVNLGGVTLKVLSTASADTFELAFQELVAAETFIDLLPSLILTSGLFCGGPVFGDVDGSGTIQALDAQLVLMHAVGLALPAGTQIARGDVDADSKVDPRDALVILSQVVGLDVSAFRIGRFVVAACQGSPPASLSIKPRPIALAQGDLFTASAELRDSSGNLLAAVNLGWSSSDTSKVKVSPSGTITAMAQGSALITAAAAPGITDTTTVTVGERHRWVVNPVVAQSQPSQIGSDLYPFSTIKQALDRALDGDTIALGVATYNEPISTTKQLVFLGDSGAAGVPTISVSSGIAGDLTRAGKQIIRRLRVANSLIGLRIRADSVELTSVRFETINGPALLVYGSKRTTLNQLSVAGALGAGLWVDSTTGGVVSVQRSSVSGVDPALAPILVGTGYALHAVGIFARADSVVLDSVRVSAVTGSEESDSALVMGVATLNTTHTLVRRTRITDIGGGVADSQREAGALAIGADTVGSLVADSVILQRIAGSGIAIRGDSLRIGNVIAEKVQGAVADPGTGFQLLDLQNLSGSGVGQVARGEAGGQAKVRRVQVEEVYWSALTLGATKVSLDSVAVNQSGYGCGLELDSTVMVAEVNFARFEHAGFGIGVCSKDSVTTGDSAFHRVGYVSIRNSVIRNPFTAVHVHADSLLLESDSIRASGWGIWQHPGGSRQTKWLKVRNVRVHGGGYQGIYADTVLDLEIAGVVVDSAQRACAGCFGTAAIEVYRTPTVRIDSSVVFGSYAGAVLISGAGKLRLYGDTVFGNYAQESPSGGFSSKRAVQLVAIDSVLVRRSVFADNRAAGLGIEFGATGDTVVVDSNTFRGSYQAIQAYGNDTLTSRMEIWRNVFKGSRFGAATEQVGVGPVRTVVFAENTIDSIQGTGTDLWRADTIRVLKNSVSNLFGFQAGLVVQRASALIETNTVICADTNWAVGIVYNAGGGRVLQNQVKGCYRGGFSQNTLASSGTTFDLVVRGNSFVRGGAVTPPVRGYQVLGGGYLAQLVANTASGGRYAEGAISVLGTPSYRNPLVVLDSNTVQGGWGRGIWVQQVDTLAVRANAIGALDTATVTDVAALSIGEVFASGVVARNVITQNKVPGILLSGQATGVAIDSNLIADNTASGLILRSPASGTLNSILRNAPYGLLDSSSAGGSVFRANNFQGNRFGVANFGTSALDATNSWWGDTLGPTCLSGCDTLSTGDSVSVNVNFLPFSDTTLTSAPAGAPVLISSTSAAIRTGEPPGAESVGGAIPEFALPVAETGEIGGGLPPGLPAAGSRFTLRGVVEPSGRGWASNSAKSEFARPALRSPLGRGHKR